MQTLKGKWLLFSILGLVLLGAGLSMAIDAGFYRMQNPEGWHWIYYGTVALVTFNAGACFFGQGIIYKIKLDK